jgi:hypothetical protein
VCQLRGSGICSGTGGKEEEEKEELSKIEREMEGGGEVKDCVRNTVEVVKMYGEDRK